MLQKYIHTGDYIRNSAHYSLTKVSTVNPIIKLYNKFLKLMRYRKALGISLSIELIDKIDELRGDVSRSKFTERLIENNEILQKRSPQSEE